MHNREQRPWLFVLKANFCRRFTYSRCCLFLSYQWHLGGEKKVPKTCSQLCQSEVMSHKHEAWSQRHQLQVMCCHEGQCWASWIYQRRHWSGKLLIILLIQFNINNIVYHMKYNTSTDKTYYVKTMLCVEYLQQTCLKRCDPLVLHKYKIWFAEN